ncbi:Uncharacterised protein [Shigella sonnei]|nr:Uncharacterised protein [Shigella sonnei]CSF95566.1 Uncharacterised protein [Shigella sonnei]CSP24161.1 Uncharacterised protein [Shigella sonnei]CSR97641.1 Uncharacterised protein [Shigella sonnei]
MQISNAAFTQLFNQIQCIGFFIRAVIRVLESTDWRNANANAIGTPFFNPGIDHFQYQTCAIFHAAAVLIGTMV